MITIALIAALGIALLCLSSWLFMRPPTARRRLCALALFVGGLAITTTNTVLADRNLSAAAQEASSLRVAEARAMVETLGSPQAYIDYLKASGGRQ